jgi:hypothetical protein
LNDSRRKSGEALEAQVVARPGADKKQIHQRLFVPTIR